jgi:hypothetical protein
MRVNRVPPHTTHSTLVSVSDSVGDRCAALFNVVDSKFMDGMLSEEFSPAAGLATIKRLVLVLLR